MSEESSKETVRGTLIETKTIMAVVGSIVGVIGVAVPLSGFIQERPLVSLRVANVEIGSRFDTSELSEQLEAIEADYGAVTGISVLELQSKAEVLDVNSADFKDEMQTFLDEIQNAITVFDTPRRIEIRLSDIEYNAGTVSWPEGGQQLDLNASYASIVFDRELIDAVIQNPEFPGEDVVRRIREEAVELFRESPEGEASRQEVARELRKVRAGAVGGIDNYSDAARITVSLTVENQSRLPTVLLSPGLLRIYRGDAVLDGYDVGSMVLESKTLGMLPDAREFIKNAFERDYEGMVFVEDLRRNVWAANTVLSKLSTEFKISDNLRSEVFEVFEEHD
jgi:hypothetical protein